MDLQKKKWRPAVILLTGAALSSGLIALGSSSAPVSSSTHSSSRCGASCPLQFDALARLEAAERMIEWQTFSALPAADQGRIVSAGAAPTPPADVTADPAPLTIDDHALLTADAYARVAHLISRGGYDRMRPVHRRMLHRILDSRDRGVQPTAQLCFTPDTDPETAFVISEALYGGNNRYQLTGRWSQTATNATTGGQGTPVTLTYSFPPDGATIPDIGVGFPGGTNALNAFLTDIYGNQAAWRNIYAQMFARWGELSGNTYLLEPNDDGVAVHQNPGVLGVRGDLRMAGMFLDGNSGTLAYNNFPNDGDMVLDTGDNFFAVITNDSRRLRNTLWHEHGHGQGLLHVCPSNGTKIMEPFINTNFLGPQLDDRLSTQRHYGDRDEHNDTLGAATALGPFGNGSLTRLELSIDDNNDTDYYSFSLAAPKQITARARPVGTTYETGPQTFSCASGPDFNALAVHDLAVQVLNSDGSILDESNAAPAGVQEQLITVAPTAGTYSIRVLGDSSNEIQAYELDIIIQNPPFIPVVILLPSGVPTAVDPGVATQFTVQILPGDDDIVPGSLLLNYRQGGGSFQTTPLASAGGNNYTATIPALMCGDDVEFFVSAQGQTSGVRTVPAGGAADPFTAIVGEALLAFNDNFQTNMGWSVASTAGDGQWTRGVPVGGGDRGDPPTDFDGSGQCYLTDNVDGNSDVDGGSTTLTSPMMDATGEGAVLSYARWFVNDAGDSPFQDVFTVQVSSNGGGAWSNLEIVGPSGSEVSGGWFEKSWVIADIPGFTPTAQFRVRFIAADADPGSVVEAGVDAVKINFIDCEDPVVLCPGDLVGDGGGAPDGMVNLFDLLELLGNWGSAGPGAALAKPANTVDLFDLLELLAQWGACP